MNDHVGPPFQGPEEVGRRHGVVDDERDPGLVGDGGDGLDVQDDAARVGQHFDEDGLAFGCQRLPEVLGIGGIDEMAGPAEALEADPELGDRAAVEIDGRDELVARLQEREEGQKLRRVARRRADGGPPAFQGRHPFLEHRHGRIGEPGIDEAEGLQVE